MGSASRRDGWATGLLAMVVIAAAAGVCPAGEANKNPHLWKPKVASVAVFKNGLGFFLREGQVSLREGWCLSGQVPPAAFGTLAIYARDKDQVVDIVGSGKGEVVDFDGVDAPADDAARRARIQACMGLKLQLTYKQNGRELTSAGKLLSPGPKFVILEADAGNFAVPLSEVTRMEVLENPIRVHVKGEGRKPPAKATVGMAYLRKGITWIPEYTLRIVDDDSAELTLRGTLVNEAEDLVHCDVNFVVGVPHFVHTNYMAPVAVGQVIRTIGSAVAPVQVRTQMMQRAAIVSNAARQMGVVAQPVRDGGDTLRGALGNLPQMAGPGGNDYTVYTMKDLTVRRGEKAIVTLFRRRIKYSHVYRWTLGGRMDHRLVLHNATDTAWTTGPALVVSGDRPLSEDLLKYVPKGGAGEVPVTTAVNIVHERTESEIERKLKAHSPSPGFFLDLVTLEGKVVLKNFEKRPADIYITAPVAGRPLSAGDDGIRSVNTANLRLLERSGSIRWHVELAPGETKTLTYTYERYVPSR